MQLPAFGPGLRRRKPLGIGRLMGRLVERPFRRRTLFYVEGISRRNRFREHEPHFPGKHQTQLPPGFLCDHRGVVPAFQFIFQLVLTQASDLYLMLGGLNGPAQLPDPPGGARKGKNDREKYGGGKGLSQTPTMASGGTLAGRRDARPLPSDQALLPMPPGPCLGRCRQRWPAAMQAAPLCRPHPSFPP